MTTCLTTFRTGLPGDGSTRRTLYQFFRTKKHVLDAISHKKLHPFAWGGRDRWFKSSHSDQKSGVIRFPIFLVFTDFFRTFGCGFFVSLLASNLPMVEASTQFSTQVSKGTVCKWQRLSVLLSERSHFSSFLRCIILAIKEGNFMASIVSRSNGTYIRALLQFL